MSEVERKYERLVSLYNNYILMENIKKYKFVYRQENLQYLYESAIKRVQRGREYRGDG